MWCVNVYKCIQECCDAVYYSVYNTVDLLRRLKLFREVNQEDVTVLNYFDELEIHPEHISKAYNMFSVIHTVCMYMYALYIISVVCLYSAIMVTFPAGTQVWREMPATRWSRLWRGLRR